MLFVVGAAVLVPLAAAGGPPVIQETWTPLPCPARPLSTLSTVEIVGCLERAVVRSDRRINAKVATIYRLLRRKSDRSAFAEGEQAWLRYRRQSCRALASKYEGGSAQPILFLDCQKRRNAQHLIDLSDTERTLRQG